MSEWGFGCILCIFVMSVLFSSLGSSEAAWSIFKWKGSGYGSLSSQQTVTDAQRCRGCLGVSFLTQKWQRGHWLPRWLTYCHCSQQAAGNRVKSKGLGLIIWAPLLFLSFLFRPPACASGSRQQSWHLFWRRADEGYWLWGRRSQRAAGPWWTRGLLFLWVLEWEETWQYWCKPWGSELSLFKLPWGRTDFSSDEEKNVFPT